MLNISNKYLMIYLVIRQLSILETFVHILRFTEKANEYRNRPVISSYKIAYNYIVHTTFAQGI